MAHINSKFDIIGKFCLPLFSLVPPKKTEWTIRKKICNLKVEIV